MRSALRLSFLVNCCTNCSHRTLCPNHFRVLDRQVVLPVYHLRTRQSTGCELVHTSLSFRHEDFPISTSRRLSWAPVTEIPEHLLKRSKAARAQAEGGTPPAEGGTPPAEGGTAPAEGDAPTVGATPGTTPATTASAPAVR